MRRLSISHWVKVLTVLIIGFMAYLSLGPAVQARNSDPRSTFTSPLTPGTIVVYRVGTGSPALSDAATEVFADEYRTDGVFVQSIPLPTTASGSQHILTASGTAILEGMLTLSENLQYLILTGYDAVPGTPNVAGTASAATNRIIGRIDASGNVDTSTRISDAFSGGNIRGAASDNGTRFWATGSMDGVGYVPFGNTGTFTSISVSFTNLRVIKVGRGQLYVSAGAGALRLGTVGTGLPTTSGQTIVSLSGIPTSGTSTYNSFYIADIDTEEPGYDILYIADDGGDVIQKYSSLYGTWASNGTIPLTNVRGLTGVHSGTTVMLYATHGGTGNTLSEVVDTAGYGYPPDATIRTIATAAPNTAFRGVAFAPDTSPTAVQVTQLSVHSTDSTLPILLIAFCLLCLCGTWLVLRRRGRTA